jgi:hypothetical protein
VRRTWCSSRGSGRGGVGGGGPAVASGAVVGGVAAGAFAVLFLWAGAASRGRGVGHPQVGADDVDDGLLVPGVRAPGFGLVGGRGDHGTICKMIKAALADTGLTDPVSGDPLTYTPHDFRRLFITDAVLNGLPPHIAQVIAGHRDINVTMGYKAVYPQVAIQSHLAFLARRRALRPTDEYRVPTDEEWTEFLGQFERRKVSVGTCGRAFSTPCVHEPACVRCALLWPDPAQRDRLVEIRDNLIARIAEAEPEGRLGEVEGLKVSLAGAEDKLTQMDRRSSAARPVEMGVPTVPPDR